MVFHAHTASPIDLTQSNAYLAQGQPFLPGTTTTNPAGAKFRIRPNVIAGQPIWLDDPNVPGGMRLNRAAFLTLPANTVVPMQGNLGSNYSDAVGTCKTGRFSGGQR